MKVDQTHIRALIREMGEAQEIHGAYATAHELYAVLQEEVDEFWDSVKQDRADPAELLQVAAVALRGMDMLNRFFKNEQNNSATGRSYGNRTTRTPPLASSSERPRSDIC